jgi:hypothetical protein
MSETVESRGRLDVRDFHRRGWLPDGVPSWDWRVEGSEVATVVLRVSYGSQPPLRVAWTRLHYGGRRPWWFCPGCQGRFAILYRAGYGYLCRRCLKLTYETQLREPHSRLQLKAERLYRRPGGDYYPSDDFKRPRYMHHRTFERLRHRAEEAGLASWTGALQGMKKLIERAGL